MARMEDITVHVKAKGLLALVAARELANRNLALFLVQLLGFLAVLVGISWWSIPAALVVGGIAVIVAVELQPSSEPDTKASDDRMRETIHRALKEGHNPFDNPDVPMSAKWISYVDLITRPKAG